MVVSWLFKICFDLPTLFNLNGAHSVPLSYHITNIIFDIVLLVPTLNKFEFCDRFLCFFIATLLTFVPRVHLALM